MVIREARPWELDEVEALVHSAYQEFREYFPDPAWQGWMDNISKTVHSAKGVVIVAEEEGRIQGVVKFYPDAAQASLGRWPQGAASMRILAVRPEARGLGYGTHLVKECLNRARAARIATLYLYTGTFMAAARHIYESLGFHRAREFDRDPGPIAYRLDL